MEEDYAGIGIGINMLQIKMDGPRAETCLSVAGRILLVESSGKDRIRERASFELHPECSPGKNGPCPAISQREKTAYAEGPLSICI